MQSSPSWVAPCLLSVTVVVALGGFAWNLYRANTNAEFKSCLLRDGALLAEQEPSNWEIPAGAFALLMKDDGEVEHAVNAPRVMHTNFLKDSDDRTSNMFRKMKSRALSGGGYVTFKWVDPETNELKPYVAYAVRNKQKQTACLARPAF